MKSTMALIFVVIVIALAGFFIYNNYGDVSGDVVNDGDSGDAQKVVIGLKDGNYYPQEIRVKAGQAVEVSFDSSVVGCYRSFNIKQLGVSKYLKTPSDSVIFTPKDKGSYRFACSMGMGTGTLIVE